MSEELSWGQSTVDTSCPLDCPDACSLAVSVEKGRVTKIDGSRRHPLTNGFICAKVRGFAEHVYGNDRLQSRRSAPARRARASSAARRGTKRSASSPAASTRSRARSGAEAILPFCYGGSNGLLTQDAVDAGFFRRLGASRLARTVCAAPTGAAALGLYGKMPGVAYEDYRAARLIVLWGVNPSASGIHLVPFVREAQRKGATLVVVDPRRTPLAQQADLHLALRPGTDLPVALARASLAVRARRSPTTAFLRDHTTGVDELRAARRALDDRARRRGRRPSTPDDARAVRRAVRRRASPAVIRCGWGLERNRNGGHAVMAGPRRCRRSPASSACAAAATR